MCAARYRRLNRDTEHDSPERLLRAYYKAINAKD
jgi:hypothetical protein